VRALFLFLGLYITRDVLVEVWVLEIGKVISLLCIKYVSAIAFPVEPMHSREPPGGSSLSHIAEA